MRNDLILPKCQLAESLLECGIVAVVRGAKAQKVVNIAKALESGGVTAIEVTMDTPGAIEMIKTVVAEIGDRAVIGAGTVLDAETARAAILAGAEFIFCPSLHQDVIRVANRYGKVVIPGVMTPTEIINAYEMGADLLKVFPAGVLGPRYFKEVAGPFKHIPLMPSGGVTLENAAEFIKAGSVALGVGGALIDKEAVAGEQYEVLTERAKKFVKVVRQARSELKK
ncbi:bifunctional 4-hydroxy-2-oxoglutarate aldolase/2-dehydro-3-deoxy-phosphogluconate aldolase [Desulfofalx alkaliphila]|uniref:bifunctional 4-hydroxy-2-oxoglutarate aldolase/2-dehydro-3-deoxy-phosphogluconate aldolase n=1 Tax=Desulfofalx alkaliphila TaxID=105483 RepID=UPI00068D30A2|nr:bifunctional 4-hydroxy-2-oxoglutarate aldolase/2-dehydro-3-deoxy-phosphogluconate aldolase [Desulfofalx alkaliphila]